MDLVLCHCVTLSRLMAPCEDGFRGPWMKKGPRGSLPDMEKVEKHTSIAWGQFLRNLWTFFVKHQFSSNFHPSIPKSLHYYPQLMHFCSKISDMVEKIAILGSFMCLGSF